MLRPRHRVKSNLIWKMVGVAVLVNVLIWPVLIRLGYLSRVRQEILLPVSLVSAPLPPKSPDMLGPLPQSPSAPPASTRAHRSVPVMPPVPVPTVSRVTVAKAPARVTSHAPDALTAERALLASLPPHRDIQPEALPVSHPKPAVAVSSQSSPNSGPEAQAAAKRAEEERRAARLAFEARLERAHRLEMLGHQVALQIAAERAHTAEAKQAPASVAELPALTPANGGNSDFEGATIVPSEPEKTPPRAPERLPAPAVFRPAVATAQPSPLIPADLQHSAWHAKFRGRFVIHKDGSVAVQVVSSTGKPALDGCALEAARRWKFRPATVNGAPVVSSQAFEMDFNVRSVP